MAENVDIALLAKLCEDTLVETKAIRRDLATVQGLAVKTVEVLSKMAQHNETRFAAVDARFAEIDGRFRVIDTRFAAIDTRFAAVDAELRGINQRIGNLGGELQLMIKSELMTALGNLETRMVELLESRFARSD
jgi:hypothetical protein